MHQSKLSAQSGEPEVDQEFIRATLPVGLHDDIFLDPVKAREFGAALSGQYRNADPFPHIVIDEFLPESLAETVLANFPPDARANDVLYEGGVFEHRKRQISPNDCNGQARCIFGFFNSGPVIEFLEGLTGIEGLIPDPYFDGGGFHEISRGGKLGVHADFRINRRLHLQRRINLLFYLNKNWQGSYGGHLELWDKAVKTRVHSIAPVFNRCVVFNTERDSYHGHPDPLNVPEGLTRKSAALYYYTASRKVIEDTASHGTVFFARPSDAGNTKRSALTWRFRSFFSVSEWLPPIIYRGLRTLKRKVRLNKVSPNQR
jgi:hypothetical protein